MKLVTVIVGVLLFALATMIIYGWGMVKQKNESQDLMNLLFSKGESKVKKYLKNHDYITITDVEKLSENLEAKQVFSPNKIVVKDKKDYARQLMNYMVKTGQVEIEGNRYKKAGKHQDFVIILSYDVEVKNY